MSDWAGVVMLDVDSITTIGGGAIAGAMGLLALVKGASAIMRIWTRDRMGDTTDRSAASQLTALQRENKHLRDENDRLRTDWARMVKEEATMSAEIRSLKDTIKEQSHQIEYLSKLVEHLIKQTGVQIPIDLLANGLHKRRATDVTSMATCSLSDLPPDEDKQHGES